MTDYQKRQIFELANKGYGYKKIANELSLSPSSVKSILKRTETKPQSEEDSDVCKCCGKPIKSLEHYKRKHFCNAQCRMKWWNSHLDMVNRKAYYTFVCIHCGVEFTAYGQPNRKYCSQKCYGAAIRKDKTNGK